MENKFNSLIIFLICVVLIVPYNVFAQPEINKDISNHWAFEYFQEWESRGLISAYEDGLFRPDEDISRVEFYTMIRNAFYIMNLTDYINKIEEFNLLWEDTKISRLEVAVVLANFLGLDVYSDYNIANTFNDYNNIPDFNKVHVGAVVKHSYMNGYPDGCFKPFKNVTRAEAVAVLNKALLSLERITNLVNSGEYELGYVIGSVNISSGDLLLKNTQINGDLLINCVDKDVTLRNVTVKGDIKISGDADSSIRLIDSNLNTIIVDNKNNQTEIIASGLTDINDVILMSGAKLEETDCKYGFTNVTIDKNTPSNTKFRFYGDFDKIIISVESINLLLKEGSIEELIVTKDGKKSDITLSSGTKVDTLIIDGKINVNGTGKINKAIINVKGVNIRQKPKKVVLKRGITANVGEDKDRRPISRNDDNDKPPIEDPGPIEDPVEKNPPIKKELELIKLQIDENRILAPTELATYGEKVTDVLIDNTSVVRGEILGKDRLRISGLEVGVTNVVVTVSNTDGNVDVPFSVEVIEAIDENDENDKAKVAEVKIDLELTLKDAVERNNKPYIELPSIDEKGYNTNISWESDNDEFIEIEGNMAKIYRRGEKTEEHCDDGCDSSTQQFIIFHSDSEGCSGDGGNTEIVTLTATISKGDFSDTKEFDIYIPWGWGKAITIGGIEEDECDDSHEDKEVEYTIDIDSYSLTLTYFSSGHGPEQVNEITLPSTTDGQEDGTTVTWVSSDEEFIEITDNTAKIHRRGKKSEIQLLHDDGGDCGGSNSEKLNVVELTATITKDDFSTSNSFEIKIPWGWGREIIIE